MPRFVRARWLVLCLIGFAAASATSDSFAVPARSSNPLRTATASESSALWAWPVSPVRIERGFIAPEHEYGAGHRGVDFSVEPNQTVLAPASGTITFVGVVVDRGIVSVEVPGGVRYSLEPVDSELAPGASVHAGDALGRVATGGHCAASCLHLGVRVADGYVNPLQFFGVPPRVRLLPWTEPG